MPYAARTEGGREVVVATPGGTTPNVDTIGLKVVAGENANSGS